MSGQNGCFHKTLIGVRAADLSRDTFTPYHETFTIKAGRKWLAPLIVAALTFLTFLPVLWNGFVDLDDYSNLVNNPLYRGLGWTQLQWMFTTLYNGHYRPLTWVSFGFDYLIWEMNPAGYHLTSLLIHVANAVLFYFVAKRLIAMALRLEDSWQLTLGAGFAALLFAIHPMRVEPVAWVTDRKELLAGFFFLATIYCYLRANSDSRSRRWIIAAFGCCVLSLLSKATAITLPAVLLILDYYPLGRLKWNPRQWFALLWEKIPFIVVAVPFAAVALIARRQVSLVVSLEEYGIARRLGQALYSIGFYVWRTFAVYKILPHFDLTDRSIISTVLIALPIILTISFFLLRNRQPAGLACWFYMIAVLAPVLGMVQLPLFFVADRFSYVACLSWPLLLGEMLSRWLRFQAGTRSERRRAEPPRLSQSGKIATASAISVLFLLASLTWKETGIWKNNETLWADIAKVGPNSPMVHKELAMQLARQGNYTAAISHIRRALAGTEWVDKSDLHNSLGAFLAERAQNGDLEEALKEFQTAADFNPRNATPFFNLGFAHLKRGELEKAVQNFEQTLKLEKLEPNSATFHAELGKILSRQGKAKEADAHFKKAIELNPNLPFCVLNTCM